MDWHENNDTKEQQSDSHIPRNHSPWPRSKVASSNEETLVAPKLQWLLLGTPYLLHPLHLHLIPLLCIRSELKSELWKPF
jgi:hypothetical protein